MAEETNMPIAALFMDSENPDAPPFRGLQNYEMPAAVTRTSARIALVLAGGP